jgi:hypothetical protein
MADSSAEADQVLREVSAIEFELGGPAYRVMQRIGIIKGAGPSVGRRSVAFIAMTWLPMLVLAALEGHAIGPTPRASLLLDFATYARLFIAVPLIFAAEMIVGPRMHSAATRFVEAGIVQPESLRGFAAAVQRVARRREAWLPEAIFLIVALFGGWLISVEQVAGLASASWHTVWTGAVARPSLAALWYHFTAIPLLQFFVLRWLWRLIVWALFLWDVSRLRLDLEPTHTDMAGGLGFLGNAHMSMWIFPFAFGCVISAELAFSASFEGLNVASLKTMMPVLFAYLVFVELATFGPLVVFVGPLLAARREALRTYGTLVQQHNALFSRKWIMGEKPADELPLGNPDMSSLVDLGSSFLVVRQMNVFPVSRTQMVQVAVISCLPALPLVFLVLPFAEVLKLIAGAVI